MLARWAVRGSGLLRFPASPPLILCPPRSPRGRGSGRFAPSPSAPRKEARRDLGFCIIRSHVPCSILTEGRNEHPPGGRNDVPRPDSHRQAPRAGRRHPEGRNGVKHREAVDSPSMVLG